VPIVIRWRVYLQSFQIWLRNIPGKANIVADWMSRMYKLTHDRRNKVEKRITNAEKDTIA
jgi:hypothetical protein